MSEIYQLQETIKSLNKENSKLKLEANLRKSLSSQLEKQKEIANEAKEEAQSKSEQLEDLSRQLSKYLSPQIYDQIFSGKQSVEVKSNRKKLTMFFSDIVGFTDISEHLESEELTNLLNFYLNEMSNIAIEFGGTIDKYVGDAIMIFFGDPETKGVRNDARQCINMAIRMQNRMRELEGYWGSNFSLKNDLQIRIGINSGFCTVGNFGSDDRLDYTIIGAPVNLASRLESAALSGSILVSEDTYLLVKDEIAFNPVKELTLKGISKPVRCYDVLLDANAQAQKHVFEGEHYSLQINHNAMSWEEIAALKEIVNGLSMPETK